MTHSLMYRHEAIWTKETFWAPNLRYRVPEHFGEAVLEVRLNRRLTLTCVCAMLVSIVMAAFVGSFFWVPSDPEAAIRWEEQFKWDVENGTACTDEARKDLSGELPKEPPPFSTPIKLMMNCLLWRPWVVFPFALATVVLIRPRVRECIIAAASVSLLMLSIGLIKGAVFFCLAVAVYLVGRRMNPAKT